MATNHFDADKNSYSQSNSTMEQNEQKQGLLKDVSFAQIAATSLAAVTSFVLSNQIGIAGSIIGVAIGAAASAVASQIYQNIIKTSAHKLRSIGSDNEQAPQQTQSRYPARSTNYSEASRYSDQADNHSATNPHMRIAPQHIRDTARRKHINKIAVRAAVVSILFAIAIVLIYAVVLNFLTQGSGLGPKIGSTATVVEQTTTQDNAKSDSASQNSSSDEKDNQSTNSSDSKESTDSNNTSTKSQNDSSSDSSTSEKTNSSETDKTKTKDSNSSDNNSSSNSSSSSNKSSSSNNSSVENNNSSNGNNSSTSNSSTSNNTQ